MKILIVEDEVLIREGMSDYLMECGYEVFEAGDGQEALDLFHKEAPDLVLLDIQQDQIRRFFVKEVQSLLPITCFKDLIATFHEIVAHPFANQDFIFYD